MSGDCIPEATPNAATGGFSVTPRNAGLFLLKLAVATGILVYLSRTQRLGMGKLAPAFQHPLLLLGAFLLLLVFTPLVLAARWHMLLRSRGHFIPFRHALGLTFTAIFFDTLMPGGTADLVRGYLFDRHFQPSRRASAAMTVVIDRFMGGMGLVFVAMIALMLYGGTSLGQSVAVSMAIPTAGVFAAFVAGFLFLSADRAFGRGLVAACTRKFPKVSFLLRWFDAIHAEGGNFASMAQSLLWSAAGHVLVIASFGILALALGESSLSISDFLFLVPMGLFAAQVPIAPAGIGVGHMAFYSLFALRGSQLGAAVFSVFIVVRFLSSLPGLVYFLAIRRQPQEDRAFLETLGAAAPLAPQ